jgi:23S rRNA pseudouridine1911/1915/1917 synthase
MNVPRRTSPDGEDRADYSANDGVLPARTVSVPAAMWGLRLDQALAQLLPEYSRNCLQGWIRDGRVRVDGASARIRQKVWGGETVAVAAPMAAAELAQRAEAIALAIVFEDAEIIVINKPPGLVVHPGSGNWQGTMLNALLHHAPQLGQLPRAGIVHRLDKDTSGLLVVAKTLQAQTDLVRQLQARTVRREYLALVRGTLTTGGTVDAAIGRHPVQRTRMAVVGGARAARTHYRVLERFARATLLECALETGRTHQIRVHMAHLGHPLIGDPVYGGRHGASGGIEFGRQALHAWRLGLLHPVSRLPLHWEAPLPPDFAALLERLRAPETAHA